VSQRILIAGAQGMLGSDLMSTFSGQAVGLGRAELDVTDEDSVARAFEKHQPTVVINAAAYTNVDGAESERDTAWRGNVLAPQWLARYCAKSGAQLIHFSTDQVFDGKKGTPYLETDATHPLNVYATTKLEGEMAALEYPNALVLRVQWLYGRRKDRFTILKDKALFTPFADQYGAPTWTAHLSEVVAKLVDAKAQGLFHFAYDDYASWAEVFAFVKEYMGYSVELQPRPTSEVKLPAARPLFSVMSNRKLCAALGIEKLGSWKTKLAEFLDGTKSV